jgi:CHAT domain-containing protein/tetratricopeptide (TPR) repeat protein
MLRCACSLLMRGLILTVLCATTPRLWAQEAAPQSSRLAGDWRIRFDKCVNSRTEGRFDEALEGLLKLAGEARQTKDNLASVLFMEQIADIHRLNLRMDAALNALNEALAAASGLDDERREMARLLAAKGDLLLDLDRPGEARTAYESALELAERLHESRLVAVSTSGIGLVLRLGSESGAEKDMLTRRLRGAGDDGLIRLRLLTALAGSYAAGREYEESRGAADQASQLVSSVDGLSQSQQTSLLTTLGLVYFELGMKSQARRRLRSAWAAAVATHEPLLIGTVRDSLALAGAATGRDLSDGFDLEPMRTRPGYLRLLAHQMERSGENYLELARFAEALRSLRAAVRLFEAVPDPAGTAEARCHLGEAYLRLGRADLASALLDEAASLAAGRSSPEIEVHISWIQGLAHMQAASGLDEHLEKAARAFDRMRALADATADRAANAEALSGLASITELRDSAKAALPHFTRARETARGANPVTEALVLNRFGEALARSGDLAAAERTLREGAETLRNHGEFLAEVSVLTNLSAVLEKRGRNGEALTGYLRAINVAEDSRRFSGAPGFAAGLAGGEDPYQAAVRLLIHNNNAREAFGIAERARTVPLLGDAFAPSAGSDAAVVEERDLLSLQRGECRRRLAVERTRTAPNRALIDQLEHDDAALGRQDADLAQRLSAAPSGLPLPAGTRSGLGIDQVQARLPGDTALLSYFATGTAVYVFAARRNRFEGFEAPLSATDLTRLVGEVRGGSLSASRDALARLYRALVAPVGDIAAAPTIAVEPSGVLHGLPFGALVDGDKYLLDSHVVFAVPNAASLVFPRKAAPGGAGLFVAADAPAGDAEVFQAWTGGAAPVVDSSSGAFRSRAPRSALLHIASTVALDPKAPLLSQVFFHSESGAEERMEFCEVPDLDLRRVGLVVLAAPARESPGSGSAGELGVLNRAFLDAGAGAVVSAAWPMPDEARRAVLRDFYRRLAERQGKAAALRRAQLQLRDRYPWPGVWAALQLTGDPSAFDESAVPTTSSVHIAGVVRAVDWPYLIVETDDHSRIRIRLQSHTRLLQDDQEAAPGALRPGATVTVSATAAESSFYAREVEIASSGGVPPAGSSTALFLDASSDPVLRAAAEAADSATEKLPNFTCRQHTARAVSSDSGLTWTYVDTISADVIYSGHEEVYRNIQHGTNAWQRGIMDFNGYTTSGEYGTVLRNLFRASVGARFRFTGTETLNERPVFVYDFWIGQPNSDWQLTAFGRTLRPAYHGTVWIDTVDLWVWRIRHAADEELPADYPWRHVENEIVFDLMDMKDAGTFLLPKLGTNVACERGKTDCGQNQIEFLNYQRYQATSEILFEPAVPTPREDASGTGVLTWSGTLGPFELLEIRNGKAMSGTLSGAPFPGGNITVSTAERVSILDPPGPRNGWNRLLLKNGSRTLKRIEIRWERATK